MYKRSVLALTTYTQTHTSPLFAGISEQQFVGAQFFSHKSFYLS